MKPTAAQLRRTSGRKSEFEHGADVALANLQGAPKFSWGSLIKKRDGTYRISTPGVRFLQSHATEDRSTRIDRGNSRGSRVVSTPVLFARIGEMTYYTGPQKGDERPRRGGGYTRSKIGHELFNFFKMFRNHPGQIFGFVQPGGGSNRQIKLERIDPNSERKADQVSNVTVIFVANQNIVGWYKRATVHRWRVELPAAVATDIRRKLNRAGIPGRTFDPFVDYAIACRSSDATLLPTVERTFRIPSKGRGAFGESNVRYLFDPKGTRQESAWMTGAIEFVTKYARGNLLETPSLENNSEESSAISEERAAGFQSDLAIRKAIEKHAMNVAAKELRSRGYTSLVDTSRFKEYDYTCQKNGRTYFVEVKGTQTGGKTVFLTKNEVAHATGHPLASILIIVHSIQVSSLDEIRAAGGKTVVREMWRPLTKDLVAIQYAWIVR